jgi:alpha-methylacyl-CoA racemase
VICYYIYETKDGRYVSLGALEPKFWEVFCLEVNHKDWITAHMTAPNEDNPVFQEVKNLFLSRTFKEWTKFSETVDCCMAPVLEAGEVSRHPYYKERQLIEERWGLRYVSTQFKNGSALKHSSPPPRHGEHTKELLTKLMQASN